jgi:uncharacterized membrane protein
MAVLKQELWIEFMLVVLAAALWFAVVPATFGRDPTPAEQIGNGLPAKQTMKSADRSDFLSAVCGAVRKNRNSGAGITAAAIAARGELTGAIVATVLRCARNADCEYVSGIVAAAILVQPKSETAISDAAIARAPDCDETVQAALRVAAQSTAAAASPGAPQPMADEGFDPREELIPVCADGVQRAIRKSLVDEFLRTHPGSYLGSCPPPAPKG